MNGGRTILVVDDDAEVREALVDLLRFEGLSVDSVQNGREGLEWLRDHTHTPSLVLLDLMMPVMDGRAFLAAKADEPALADVPVILLTAGGDYRELRGARGVATALPKPVQVAQLMAAIAACG